MKNHRPLGILKGAFTVPDDFDDPLPDDIINAFYGECEEEKPIKEVEEIVDICTFDLFFQKQNGKYLVYSVGPNDEDSFRMLFANEKLFEYLTKKSNRKFDTDIVRLVGKYKWFYDKDGLQCSEVILDDRIL